MSIYKSKFKKKNKTFPLILVIVLMLVAYALMSTNLDIMGLIGLKQGSFDIHWESVAVKDGSVESEDPVIDSNRTMVTYSAAVELPGDFYEFNIDAKNDGNTISKIKEIRHHIYNSEDQEVSLPGYINYKITYAGTNKEPKKGDLLYPDEKQTYTIRVEYDMNSSTVPAEELALRLEDEIDYEPIRESNIYTITLNPGEGSVSPTTVKVAKGEEIGNLPTPRRHYYHFDGWYTAKPESKKVESSYIVTENKTLYAKWTAKENNSYIITLDSKGGTVDPTEIEVDEGSEIGELPTPTKENSKFSGWYSEESGGEEITSSYIPTDDKTIYARWQGIFTITLDPGAGTVIKTSITAIEGEKIGKLPTPTRENYTFDEWQLSDGTVVDENFEPTESTTIYAKYFPSDKVAEINGTYYDTLQLAVDDVPTTDVETKIRLLKDTSEKVIIDTDKNIVLDLRNNTVSNSGNNSVIINYAKLKIENGTISERNHVIAIDNNSTGTLIMNNAKLNVYASYQGIYNNGGTVTISGDSYFHSVANKSSVVHNTNDGIVNIIGGTIVTTGKYAVYNESGTMNIGVKDGNVNQNSPIIQGNNYGIIANSEYNFYDGTIKGTTYSVGTATTGDNPTIASDTTFSKISDKETTTELITSTEIIGASTYNTLYLSPTDKLKITFNANGGYVDPTFKSIDVGRKIGRLPTPIREHYTFDGWYTEMDGGTEISEDDVPSDSVTYYAHWTEDTYYMVTFNNNDGTESTSSVKVYEGSSIGELPTPTRENYTLKGWYTKSTGGTEITSSYIPTENITIYAHWIGIKQVTYRGNGGLFANKNATNNIEYKYVVTNNVKYSHTSNIDDTGVASDTYFYQNDNRNDIVTIEGAESLNVEVWYSTESIEYDWLAIYPAGVTPTVNNFEEATISGGKLGGGESESKPTSSAYHKIYTVEGDTVQFYFHADTGMDYYGYYAIITATTGEYQSDNDYIIPMKSDASFKEWNTQIDGTGISYSDEEDVINNLDHFYDNVTLYAQWKASTITKFDTGENVNIKLKTLANDTLQETNPSLTVDTNITAIKKSKIAPNIADMTEDNVLSISGYPPIYAWYDNGIIYWWSEADKWYLNENSGNMFSCMHNVTSIDISLFDTTMVTNMYEMFMDDKAITELNLTNFNTSNVTNMYGIFMGDNNLTKLNISSFDTSNVTDMTVMFLNCGQLTSLDLSNFNTSKVTNMNGIFGNCYKVTTINISNWNFKNINNPTMIYLTSDSSFATKWTTLNTIIMDNVVLPTSCNNLFGGATRNVTSIKTISLHNADTSNVTSMYGMFTGLPNLKELDLSSFDTNKVTNMNSMFNGDAALKRLDLSSFNTSIVTDMGAMFSGCNSLKDLNLSNFDFTGLTVNSSLIMSLTSGGLNSLVSLTMDNTKLPANMNYGLGGLSAVEYISLNNSNTSGVTNMASMFAGDAKLKRLDLRSFNTTNVTNMNSMFSGCTVLKTIYVGDNFVVGQVTSSTDMFKNATNLVGGKGTTYDADHIDKEYAHYDGGIDDPGYFDDDEAEYCAVTLNPNGGTVSPTTIYVKKNSTIDFLPEASKSGLLRFNGWYTDLTAGTRVDTTYVVNSDITIYARYITLNLGDYIYLTPSKETYTVPASLTGYSSDQTIKIAGTSDNDGLRLWRIIDIHDDESFDVVSEYVSADEVYLEGVAGYKNAIKTLNTIAAQYEVDGYTIGSRYIGYDGQTEIIQNTYAFDGSTNNTPSYRRDAKAQTEGTGEEYQGGVLGDTLYLKDYQLVKNVYGSGMANKVGTTTAAKYWLASRWYFYDPFIIGVNYEELNKYTLDFSVRNISNAGSIGSSQVIRNYYRNESNAYWRDFDIGSGVRPILTIKPDIMTNGGTGTKDNPYTLN